MQLRDYQVLIVPIRVKIHTIIDQRLVPEQSGPRLPEMFAKRFQVAGNKPEYYILQVRLA
jgi:hypothetical protein